MEDFKKDIDSNTIIVGDFNTPLSKMDKSSKQNIKKDIVSLNNALDEMDLTDIYRAFHPMPMGGMMPPGPGIPPLMPGMPPGMKY